MSFLNVTVTYISNFSKRRPKPSQERFRPPSAEWLLANRHLRQGQIALTRGETPLALLYRMYEYLVTDFNLALRTEIERFFNHQEWAVAQIPDPQDPDPARYAILAVLPQFLVIAFNRLIELGLPRDAPAIIGSEEWDELAARPRILEEVPPWTADVPKLEEMLVIPDAQGHQASSEEPSPEFLAMNVHVRQPHFLFVEASHVCMLIPQRTILGRGKILASYLHRYCGPLDLVP